MRHPEVVEIVEQILRVGESETEAARGTTKLQPVGRQYRKNHASLSLTECEQCPAGQRNLVAVVPHQLYRAGGVGGVQNGRPLGGVVVGRNDEVDLVAVGVEAHQEGVVDDPLTAGVGFRYGL